jgi:hypothetical protein
MKVQPHNTSQTKHKPWLAELQQAAQGLERHVMLTLNDTVWL